MKIHSGLEV